MDRREFLALLADTAAVWMLTPEGAIRQRVSKGRRAHCPLSLVAGTDPGDVQMAARRLNMLPFEGNRIANAADLAKPETFEPDLRAALINACQLTERFV